MFVFNLPGELCRYIINHLSEEDLFSLSLLDKRCRLELAPTLFETVRFTNRKRSSKSALAAVRAHGTLIQKIEFTCPLPIALDTAVPSPKARVLSRATRKLLRGRGMPRLRGLNINFSTTYNSLNWESSGAPEFIGRFKDTENRQETVEAERNIRWRALLKETFKALSANRVLSELTLDRFIPTDSTAFYTKKFHSFLSRLESFTLHLWGPDEMGVVAAEASRLGGYRSFLDHMPNTFFSYMNRLKHLEIHAPDGVPLGSTGDHATALSFSPDNLPLLTSLRLRYYFIGKDLEDFIAEHFATLSHITLTNCMAYCSGSWSSPPPPHETWEALFTRLAQSSSNNLLEFRVVYDDERLQELYSEGEDPLIDELGDLDALEKLERALRRDPNRKTFAHGCIVDTGYLVVVRRMSRMQAARKRDYYAYKSLMKLVKRNAAAKSSAQIWA